jgi:hypothetical protein
MKMSVDIKKTNLNIIHESDTNVAVYDRDIQALASEIKLVLDQELDLRVSGDVVSICNMLKNNLAHSPIPNLISDIESILQLFKELTGTNSFRLLLATVNTNMCRRFHTDGNDLRLLCTYSGPGTIWLTEDNVNRNSLNTLLDNDSIVLDETKVQQAALGSIVILKGAIYPKEGTKAIVHRSPTIEETGERRLLLRIDTNDFLNF